MTRPAAVRRLGTAGLVAMVTLLAFGSDAALGRTVYVASLTGDAEVPGPGDPNGEGAVQLSIDVDSGQLCWELFVDLAEPAVAAHIHDGDVGVAGPVVVTLGTPDANGESIDCANGLDPTVLQAIVDDPAGFYVNVHSETYQDGAIRGQLDGLEIVSLSVGKLACPAGVDGPEDLGGPGDPVCSTVRPGPIDAPPDGYVWDPEPVGFAWQTEVIEPDGNLLTEGDASPEGGGTCNPATLTCGTFFAYEFGEILAGDTEVTQLTSPPGYEFGWAEVFSVTEGGPEPVVLGTDGSTIAFDSSGTEGVAVRFFDIIPAGEPTPDPTTTPTPAPGATARPVVTPPATDSDALGDAREQAGTGSLMAALAVVFLLGTTAVLAGRRAQRRR
jgi:CHRD domain